MASSARNVVVQLGYQDTSESSQKTIRSLENVVHDQTEWTLGLNAPSTTLNIFTTNNVSYVDRVLGNLAIQATPTIYIRMGLVSVGGMTWSPWCKHILTYHRAIHLGGGHSVRVDTADQLFEINRSSRTRLHEGKISAIIVSIAESNGLKSNVEPTVGDYALVQSNQTDLEFIIERLIRRSISESGMPGYRLFIRDGVLHFHTADYWGAVKELNYSRGGPFENLVFSGKAQKLIMGGVGGSRAIAHNLYDGSVMNVRSDPGSVTTFANEVPAVKSISGVEHNLRLHVGPNGLDEVKAITQGMYGVAYAEMFDVEVTADMATGVGINDVIKLGVGQLSQSSPWAGNYTVGMIRHLIKEGAMTSLIRMNRGERAALSPESPAVGHPSRLH